MRRGPDAFWHATPLHYLPHLLAAGNVRSAAMLRAEAPEIAPRPTAIMRKRKLGLESFVHLSLSEKTPLLTDKRARGWPHVLFSFPPELYRREEAAFLAYNTKKWGHRDDFRPVFSLEEKEAFLSSWRGGAYPSAELLIAGSLSLSLATALYVASPDELALMESVVAPLALATPPLYLAPERFPPA